MVTLFPNRQRDRKPIRRGRKRARGVRSIGTWRIFQPIEIQDKFTLTLQTLAGQRRVKKPASGVCSFRAGWILQDKKKLCALRVFQNWLKPVGFSMQRELRVARHRLIVARTHQRNEGNLLGRIVRYPLCRDLVRWIGWIPLQPVEFGERRRLCVFEANGKAVRASNYVKIQVAVGDSRIHLVVVRLNTQNLLGCRYTGYLKAGGEPIVWRPQLYRIAFKLQNGQIWRRRRGQPDFVVGS